MRKMTELVKMEEYVQGDDFIVIAEFPDVNYALVYRGGTYLPWVAAWCLDRKNNCWSNGHYFETINEAMKHIQSKLKED